MAKSEYVNTNTEYESHFWVRWSQKSQNIAENYTIINWSCGVTPGHKFGSYAIRMSAVYINGVLVYGGGTYSDFLDYKEHTLGSGELRIDHDPDGTKTFNISSFTGWLWENHNYSAAATPHSLEAIPRKATITAAADFTDVDNPSISFNNPGGFRMDVWLEPNPIGDHLCVKENIPNTGSYTWYLTDAEREQLRSQCAGNDCTIRLGLYSYVGNTQYHDYQDKKFIMTENQATKPVVTMNVTLNNSKLASAFDGLCVQGKSKVDVALSAEGKYGSDIQSYSAVVDGKTYNSGTFTSDVIQNPVGVKITGYAKDSRKFTGSKEQTIDVIEYSKPLVVPLSSENAIQCYRSDGNGNKVGNSTSLWIKAKRSYHSVKGKNICALQWRAKPASEEWDDKKHSWKVLLSPTTTTDEYNAQVEGTFDLSKAYTVQINAIDLLGETDTHTFEIPTRDVALHLGKGGKNVSIGTYCDYSEERTFFSEWKAIFDKDVVVGGDIYIGDMTLADYIKSVIN